MPCAVSPPSRTEGLLPQEMDLPTRTDNADTNAVRARADANFKKEERAKEGAQAMLEYQSNGREIRENMAKLKALRLAKEAADQAKAANKETVKEVAGKVRKRKSA
jgi:hypothetical protein